jgi:hypothetical protein
VTPKLKTDCIGFVIVDSGGDRNVYSLANGFTHEVRNHHVRVEHRRRLYCVFFAPRCVTPLYEPMPSPAATDPQGPAFTPI